MKIIYVFLFILDRLASFFRFFEFTYLILHLIFHLNVAKNFKDFYFFKSSFKKKKKTSKSIIESTYSF